MRLFLYCFFLCYVLMNPKKLHYNLLVLSKATFVQKCIWESVCSSLDLREALKPKVWFIFFFYNIILEIDTCFHYKLKCCTFQIEKSFAKHVRKVADSEVSWQKVSIFHKKTDMVVFHTEKIVNLKQAFYTIDILKIINLTKLKFPWSNIFLTFSFSACM